MRSVSVLIQLVILSTAYFLQNSTIFCIEIEKHSLLTFKQSLEDPYNRLSSWDGEVDCCKWRGVVCNNFTGHVSRLHLGGEFDGSLSGKISPSLLNLKFLTHLDLSRNNFSGEAIPSFIGSLASLEHLDLSNAGFEGKVPYTIGNLSNLHALNLESKLVLEADSVEWLLGLSKLEYLNMNLVNLSKATNWAQVINSLPSLLELNCSGCSLDFMFPVNHANLSSSLTLISLPVNNFYPYPQSLSIPSWFFHLNNLLYLDLSFNLFIGSIPPIINATKLQYVNLALNNFTSIPESLYFCNELEFLSLKFNRFLQGEISSSIGNLTSLQILDLSNSQISGKFPREVTQLCRMQSLDLSYNQLNGKMQNSLGNMSDCFLGSLELLLLSDNLLSGHLTEQVGEFRSLTILDLAFNSLSGAIPVSLGNISSLETLTLQGNKFTGNIPKSFGQLSNLEATHVYNNKLEGIVTESHFANLSKLVIFVASGNHLTLNVRADWIPPIQLAILELASWSLGKDSDYEVPSWLQAQRNITLLDISNTGISGTIPPWFLNLSTLNVSLNNLRGKLPDIIGSRKISFQYLYLSNNNLSGSLPRIEQKIHELDLSHNLFSGDVSHLVCDATHETYKLQFLDLEGNHLSGELRDCWKKWPDLQFLKLGNNRISGSIPESIWFPPYLLSLSLYGNKFSGRINFAKLKRTSLLKIDLSYNNLEGNIPALMGTSLVNLTILLLRSNKLSGDISPDICNLQHLQILDLSNNQFSGEIPRCISNFTAMATQRVLTLDFFERENLNGFFVSPVVIETASIVTKGVELEYSRTLSLVTSIDLSVNHLSGEIPKELTSLAKLRSLNLSQNNFTGSIPESIGAMKQLESLDFSRNSLSGQIPNSFGLLSYLNHLNLSFNKLTGRVPQSTQLQSLDASSFIGNNLCGPPLSNCSSGGDGHEKEEKEGDEKLKIEWLYILLSLGYALGFSAVCTALVLKKPWRDAYFEMLECTWDKIYVYFHVKWRKLTRTAASTSPR